MDSTSTAKRVKDALKLVGKPHVKLLREALSDGRALRWFIEGRQMLQDKTPLQVIEEGNVERVREVIQYCYDFSTLPQDEEEEKKEEEEGVGP